MESWAGPGNKAILCIHIQAFCHFTIPESLVPRASPSFQSLAVYCKRREAGWGPGNKAITKEQKTFHEVTLLVGYEVCFPFWNSVTQHYECEYHIAGNFRGRKLLGISRFCGYLQKFSLRNLKICRPLMQHEWAICESFCLESFLLYSIRVSFSPSFPLDVPRILFYFTCKSIIKALMTQ